MKKLQKGLVVSMALAFLLTSTAIPDVFAASKSSHGQAVKQEQKELKAKSQVDKKEAKEAEKILKEQYKAIEKAGKQQLEAQKDALEDEKDKLEEQKEGLEKQYEEVSDDKDVEGLNELKAKLDQLKKDLEVLKKQADQAQEQIKEAIKANYTTTELDNLKKAGEKIKKGNKNITILPVENLIVKGVNVKFDTPPVIKSGRTLIPVRALSQAFGAKVQWISAEKKVVITKGTTEIVLILDSNKIYVNGVESTLDVPATSLNGRTVVPLKFIVEKLGLLVKWNKDKKEIEIEQPPVVTPPTTTGGAIDVTGSAITVMDPAALTVTTGNTSTSPVDEMTGATTDATVIVTTLR